MLQDLKIIVVHLCISFVFCDSSIFYMTSKIFLFLFNLKINYAISKGLRAMPILAYI